MSTATRTADAPAPQPDASLDSGPSLRARVGQMGNDLIGAMLVIVIAATVGYVGIQVASETQDSAGFDTAGTDAANQTQFENASESLTLGLESAFSLAEVVFIVLFLGIIITVLVGLRRR
jgi:hypothetical protein